MKRVIGVRKQLERGAGAKLPAQRFEKGELGELVAGALEKEHR
jgi:hypothetical protein